MLIKKELITIKPISLDKFKVESTDKFLGVSKIITNAKGEEIIVVDFYKKSNKKEPVIRFFSDGKNFLIYAFDKNTSKWQWYKKLISSIADCNSWNTAHSDISSKTVVDFFLNKNKSYHYYGSNRLVSTIDNFISAKRSDNAEKSQMAKRKKIDDVMDLFPDYPDDFTDYLKNNVFGAYIFLDKTNSKTKKKNATCTYCKSMFEVDKTAKHKALTVCPCCKRNAHFWEKRHYSSISEKQTVIISHKTDEMLFLRWIDVSMKYSANDLNPLYYENEFFRMVENSGKIKYYECKNIYTHGEYWRNKEYLNVPQAFVYYNNLTDVFGENYHNVNLKAVIENTTRPIKFVELLHNLKNFPQTEYLVKMGLTKLASELVDEELKSGHDFQSILGIDKQYLPFYKNYNISHIEHNVIKHSKTWVNEESIVKLQRLKLNSENVINIINLLEIMSFERFINYFEKQKNKTKSPLNSLLIWYKDYIQMASDLKIDLSRKSVRFPKSIKEAHDRILLQFKEVETKIADEKFKLAKENLYRGLNDYRTKEYIIILPDGKSDFVKEGNSLSHCVGSIKSYFDNHMSGEKMIFFIRKASAIDVPFVTMQIDMKRLVIVQIYGFGDKAPTIGVRQFANGFLKELSTNNEIKKEVS